MYWLDLGRWGVIDEKSDKYANFSPYSYALNDPIIFVDPDGRDVQQVAGGYNYTGEDARAAFNYIVNAKKNVFIHINENAELRKYTNAHSTKGSYGTWSVYSAKDLQEASFLTQFRDNKSIKNMVIETHGTVSDVTWKVAMTTTSDESWMSSLIYTNSLRDYDPNADCSGEHALKALMDKVQDGGNIVFNVCRIAKGADGDEFLKALYNFSGKRLNISTPLGWGKRHNGTKEYHEKAGILLYGSLNSKLENNPLWKNISPGTGTIKHFTDIIIDVVGERPLIFKK
jgi:hypothetical protein